MGISPALAAQGNGPGTEFPRFIASSVYGMEGPVYALDAGEFDLSHVGIEVACLTQSASVVQLSPNYLVWEAAMRAEGIYPILDMTMRPTIDIGDVRSDMPGGEIVVFSRAPSIVRVVFNDPNAGWSEEVVDDKTDFLGDGWGARAGDFDPHRPGDEIFYIFEAIFDFSIGTLFREVNGAWEEEIIYGDPAAEVGMDSAVGDFDWEHSGPEIVIGTEMGPTYAIACNEGAWAKQTIWDDEENAAWVIEVADLDWRSPGDEIVYGTRYNNRILLSRHTAGGPHEVEVLFTGNVPQPSALANMWDIAVGDIVVRSPGLEVLGVDHTGSVYLVRRVGDTWSGQVIWQDSHPLYAVTVGDLLPQWPGDEILVAGESGIVTLLTPVGGGPR
jgi:hypothetical protein